MRNIQHSSKGKTKSVMFGMTVGASADSFLRGQLSWFKRQGWDTRLVTTPDARAHAASEREDVPLESLQMSREISPKNDLKSLFSWLRLLYRKAPYATVVGTPKAGLLGGLAAWAIRVPRRVYVVHGLRLEGTKGLLLLLLSLIERVSLAVATDVVVVSHSLGHQLLKRKLVAPSKCWIIGDGSCNGIDPERFQKRRAEVDAPAMRESLGLSPHATVVGFIGRITRDKGIHLLLEAIEEVNSEVELQLLIVGKTEADPGVELEKLSSPNICWVDGSDDIPGLLSIIDILVLPTYREGFPTVPLEAAASGVPTITTNATGAIDSVVDGVTGMIVPVGDRPALSIAIKELAENVTKRHEMGKAAYDRALVSFRPERIWSGLESILLGAESSDVFRINER